ncbi:MAG: LytTR family transcriptional regulator [Roseovarius sp.]|nr:LytTR family transcriptional regulator [Roseovarius sp.]
MIIAAACRAVVLPLCLGWRPLIVDAAMSLGTATLLAPLICTLRASLDPVLTHDELAVGVIWVHTMFVVAPIFLLRRQFGLEKGLSAPAPERPRLARRLPEALQGADILRLSGNGHTVEVVTDQGAHTLRLRLSDAIDEMEPVAGMCTHRSHWVTLAAMTGRECREGKVFLRLSNGERVPVSRTYAPQLEAAGVIPPRPVSED